MVWQRRRAKGSGEGANARESILPQCAGDYDIVGSSQREKHAVTPAILRSASLLQLASIRPLRSVFGILLFVFMFACVANPGVILRLSMAETNQHRNGLSLVVSFWAMAEEKNAETTTGKSMHRREIESAMLANLENPYLDELVVILDSSTARANCRHFHDRMVRLQRELHKIIGKPPSKTAISNSHKTTKLKCIDRMSGQPNYFELFNYTLSPQVTGKVVMMSNADQVFDNTVALARRVQPNTIITLSTQGYNATHVPKRMRDVYNALNREVDDSNTATPGLCRGGLLNASRSLSWDTYIFQPSTIRLSLSLTNFQRKGRSGKMIPFYMNELGAENAALYALIQNFANPPLVRNACKLIHSWDFHFAPKSHRVDANVWPGAMSDQVPGPRESAFICASERECGKAFSAQQSTTS